VISGPNAAARPSPAPLRGRAAFAALRRGRRLRRGPITVTWADRDPEGPPRVAYAVGRRVGGAVVRNRIRRRLRAVVRDIGADLAPGAYLIGAGAEAASLPYDELKATVSEAARAVSAR
jgi:ribonuclease P protein component